MADLNLSEALRTALEAVAAARAILLAECARTDGPRGEIGHCPADDEAEWVIRNHVLAAFPDWGYLGEETGARARVAGVDYVWIVDPNDGTRAMQRGFRGHAVSVGLVRRGVPVLGVVCAVNAPDDRGDLVAWAEGCGPIRRNGLPLESVAWPHGLGPDEIVCLSLSAIRNPVGNLAAVAPARFVGMPSIAYRLALVAVGECAATVSLQHLNSWDFAAGHALVRAAGGVVVDQNGLDITYAADGQSRCLRIFAGGKDVVDELVPRAWERTGGSGFGEAAPPPNLAPMRLQPGRLIHDADVLSRAHGCVLGQIAGDSLGAAQRGMMAGQPGADSELALLLARTLIACGGFDRAAVAQAYAGWFDIGIGAKHPYPLARVSPLGIWGALRDPHEVAAAARQDAQLTHPQPVCQDASALFAVTVAAAISQGLDPRQTYDHALAWCQTTHVEPSVRGAVEAAAHGPPPGDLPGSILVAMHNAFFELLDAKDFTEAMLRTVRRGGDASTNAAICGSLVGAVYGRTAIPAPWQRMVLSCRPMPGQPGVQQPRPALYWAVDALVLAERLLGQGDQTY